MEIYLHQDGERAGPFTLENVQGRLEGGQLTVSDAAWFEGCSDWVTVQDVPGIMLPGGAHLVEVAREDPAYCPASSDRLEGWRLDRAVGRVKDARAGLAVGGAEGE